jgi:hypothetical protein
LFVTAVDTSPGPAVGDSVCKTGMISGITCGAITHSCVNINSDNPITLICQMKVHMYSGTGDSGSPIYHWTSSADSTVTLAGILWGGPTTDSTWYSQWDWVDYELFHIIDTAVVIADTLGIIHNGLGGRVSGPDSIGIASTYAWDANATGGTGTYGYQWKYKNDGSSTWTSLGTSASQSRAIDNSNPTFTIRVIITSGSDTTIHDKWVIVDIPPPLTGVDISGPDWVHAGQVCHWTATPAGGSAPFTYEWDGGGDDSDTYGVYVLENFSVGVTVTDANGAHEYNSMYVSVDEGGPGC